MTEEKSRPLSEFTKELEDAGYKDELDKARAEVKRLFENVRTSRDV